MRACAMLLATLDAVAVNSTGQTARDLLGLRALWKILQVNNNRYLSDEWLPPALTNPEYIPETQAGLKVGLTLVFLFGLLLTGISVCFKIVATQKDRATKLLFLEDWLLILALTFKVGDP
ncbi:hypothetical protein ABW21_db0200995 [Orbilia brochopaga]|nr:hypothetical protein ABW21_db0200995 [Drechslerella brochopaga]